MKSMTGYALTEKTIDGAFISVEIKSYNSRYLDIYLNIPFWLNGLEPALRNFFSQRISRGKIEISIKIKDSGKDIQILTNKTVAKAYMTAISEIAEEIGLSGSISLDLLVRQDGVIQTERNIDIEEWEKKLTPILEETFNKYENTRITEGKVLKKDISKNLNTIYEALKIIKKYTPQMEEIFTQTIRAKFKELVGNEINEQRIMQETAAMIVKYTINEEVVRLEAHADALLSALKKKEPVGKKIDFICQELNREINTIGSKNQIMEIGGAVISIKDSIENIREQGRNVE